MQCIYGVEVERNAPQDCSGERSRWAVFLGWQRRPEKTIEDMNLPALLESVRLVVDTGTVVTLLFTRITDL